jgi:hypothetical protein
MKNVPLDDNAWPHSSLHTYEAVTKMGWTVLRLAHSPHLAPSDYHMFESVTDTLREHHFVDNNKLKQSFHDVL